VRRATAVIVGICCVFSILSGMARADVTAAAKPEIQHLLDYLETSGCRFFRNGKWYTDMKMVREHAEKKLSYFAGKGRIHSAEDFIELAASKSELSGKPYLVRCGEGPVVTSAQWLKDELDRYRKVESTRGGQ
jgi:hypothetical protein